MLEPCPATQRWTFWAPAPSPSSCLPAERQGPQLGVSNLVIAQGVQGSRSRKTQTEQGWMGVKATACSPSLPPRDSRRATALRKTPPLNAGSFPAGTERGVRSWGIYFLYYYVCATVVLAWHYCNYNKVLVPSAVCLSVRPSWVMCVLWDHERDPGQPKLPTLVEVSDPEEYQVTASCAHSWPLLHPSRRCSCEYPLLVRTVPPTHTCLHACTYTEKSCFHCLRAKDFTISDVWVEQGFSKRLKSKPAVLYASSCWGVLFSGV